MSGGDRQDDKPQQGLPAAGPAVDFGGTERFEILGRLGAGGMGVVYRARDRERNVLVALKTLRSVGAEALLRFKNEFRVLADLEHPNLVALGELIFDADQWFFTMELVEGVDFLGWVRPSLRTVSSPSGDFALPQSNDLRPVDGEARERPPLDEARLRAALPQLAHGLNALHRAGMVHRDIKPSNVLCTREGRVVLLDFGLTTDVGGHTWSNLNVVGTADYMAPEQAASKPTGPAADWYSVGVVLYEALTGRLPFVGAPLEVLIQKQRTLPPPPSELAPGVAPDLAELCMRLLATDPAERPSDEEIARRLNADDPARRVQVRPPSRGGSAASPFVGRSNELAALHEAFEAMRTGHPLTVVVHGESGVGKSVLVRRFVEQLRAARPGAIILSGRCYERESVPYKALDGVIDALSRHMMRLPEAQVAQLLPLQAGLLGQAFPVLRRVPSIARAPIRPQSLAEPVERRARVFRAVRELFIRMAERHPVTLAIDDLQWADGDSLALLGEVLRPPEAPSILVVATLRTDRALDEVLPPLEGDVRRLHVGPLPPAEARDLVQLLLEDAAQAAAGADELVQAIAREARGHPLFIDELVRHALEPTGSTRPGGPVRLDEAVWARVRRLEPAARTLLEVVAVAGTPLPISAAAGAEIIEAAELNRAVGILRVASLVRLRPGAEGEALEPYHDRVREAVLAHLDEPRRRHLHGLLARAFEGSRVDPQTLSVHWLGAGDPRRAAGYAARAAERATEALAFDHAARLYRRALELDPDAPERIDWFDRLGTALVNVGRGGEAALAFLEAAKLSRGGASVQLERRAAEQLLVMGLVEEGLAGLRMVFRSLGVKMPETRRALGRSLALRRAWLRLRGLGFTPRTEGDIEPQTLLRLDTFWSAIIGLGFLDGVRASEFQARHLALALSVGEPFRLTRALAGEAIFVASGTPRDDRRSARLLERAEVLAKHVDRPEARAVVAVARTLQRFYSGQFADAFRAAEAAQELVRSEAPELTWELRTARRFGLYSLVFLGELGELHRRLPAALRNARERGDVFETTTLRSGPFALTYLAEDDPDRGRFEIEEAYARWPEQPFLIPHLQAESGLTTIDLYLGDGPRALERVRRFWPAFTAAQLWRGQYTAILTYDLRARAALSSAARTPHGDRQRGALLAAAEADAVRLARGPAWARPFADVIRAGRAAAAGEGQAALDALAAAEAGLLAHALHLHARCVRRRRGELLGDENAVREADAWLTAQRVKNPRRMMALFTPGFPD